MTVPRFIRVLLTLVFAISGGLLAQSPASAAEVSCTHKIEWYRSNYEVSATEIMDCNQVAHVIYARITMTKPKYLQGYNNCVVEWSCRAVVYTSNPSGLQQFCATASGFYMVSPGSPPVTRAPKQISSCIEA
ncbi:hypothetical protein [Acrocarpospora catenulata]|uniref:hypothetical protein n=1 Tax=Acrocarpospora catenulata TaxID=2836182 RepID=UPI001BD9244F|nr:hypothetical protein [Acrocarpospora catenulata]